MNFRLYNQNQAMLVPPLYKECLPADHFCFLVSDIVDGLDLSVINETYKNGDKGGAPAYNPRLLIKVIFYAYSQGIRSSRKIENSLFENIPLRFLSGNTHFDHGTVNLFRKNHLGKLPQVFAQIVVLASNLGLANLSDISIDGTKIKANASKKSLFTKEDIEKVTTRIRDILAEAEKIDEAEDNQYGDKRGYNQIPEKLANPEIRVKEIEKLKSKLLKLEGAKSRIEEKQTKALSKERKLTKNKTSNLTDPEANLMKMKDKSYKIAYNCQFAAADQIITAYDITDDPVDTRCLQAMVKKTIENTKQKLKAAKADAGYFSQDNIDFLKENKIEAFIPDTLKRNEEKKEKKSKISPYDSKRFTYDKEKNEFICPEGERLKFNNNRRNGFKEYAGINCNHCLKKSLCTKGKKRYIETNQELNKLKQEMREKINSPEGKTIYQKRMWEIEPVIGNLKHNQKVTTFLCRGKRMVTIELGLSCTAHNLVKIFNGLKKKGVGKEEINLSRLMRLQTA